MTKEECENICCKLEKELMFNVPGYYNETLKNVYKEALDKAISILRTYADKE